MACKWGVQADWALRGLGGGGAWRALGALRGLGERWCLETLGGKRGMGALWCCFPGDAPQCIFERRWMDFGGQI